MPRTPGNAGKRYPAEPLTPEDVRLLLRACGRRGPCAARNSALIWALWRTGARIGELLAVRPHHVEADALRIVARLKGGLERVVPLEVPVRLAIDRWLEHRRARSINGAAPVFSTLAGKPLEPSHVRRLLARLARRAGLERRVHAHAFRHAAATEWARAGVPMVAVQQLLGHRSIATTAAYLHRLTGPELAELASARPLPAWALR